jgi:hypothetical protein
MTPERTDKWAQVKAHLEAAQQLLDQIQDEDSQGDSVNRYKSANGVRQALFQLPYNITSQHTHHFICLGCNH